MLLPLGYLLATLTAGFVATLIAPDSRFPALLVTIVASIGGIINFFVIMKHPIMITILSMSALIIGPGIGHFLAQAISHPVSAETFLMKNNQKTAVKSGLLRNRILFL
jgi:uncharacterized membrane protein AbrB (regulator of aidB expression)